MDKITLYTTHCPKCSVIEKKLQQKEIEYDIVEDIEEIEKLGYMTVPLLKIGDEILDFVKANEWVNKQ